MQNKSNAKNRDDIKVIITATALTLTLAFWNLFSGGSQKPVQAANPEPAIAPQMQQGKILLGGPPPRTTIIVSQSGSPRQQNQQNRQQPVTNTASSK